MTSRQNQEYCLISASTQIRAPIFVFRAMINSRLGFPCCQLFYGILVHQGGKGTPAKNTLPRLASFGPIFASTVVVVWAEKNPVRNLIWWVLLFVLFSCQFTLIFYHKIRIC